MEVNEIRKFVGMERGMRLPHQHPHTPHLHPLPAPDGGMGKWVDGQEGLKPCNHFWSLKRVSLRQRWGAEKHL